MSNKNYYDILEIPKTATADEIRSAYKKLALKYHPDKNLNNQAEAEAKFKEIQTAYECLSDPAKKKSYDTYGSESHFRQGGGQYSNGFGSGGFEDIFSQVFGGADIFGQKKQKQKKGQLSPRAGHDVEISITISLKESYIGIKQKVEYSRFIQCSSCNGMCCAAGEKLAECTKCNGTGYASMNQGGFFSVQYECSACNGEGFIIKNGCVACKGTGRKRITESTQISIPAGVEKGNILKLNDLGDAGIFGGQSGNLLVAINVQKDNTFTREGNNLRSTIKLQYPYLVMGCEIVIKLINDSEETIKVPAGSQVNDIITIKGKGFSRPGSRIKGDCIISLMCDIPKNISNEAEKHLKDYASNLKLEDKKPQDGFLSGLFKNFFQ